MDGDEQLRTLWCGNLPEKLTEELLFELFLQAGPVEKVKIPTDRDGRQLNYGFVTFKHECSVDYSISLFENLKLCDQRLNLQRRIKNAPQNERLEEIPLNPLGYNSLVQRISQMSNTYVNMLPKTGGYNYPNVSPQGNMYPSSPQHASHRSPNHHSPSSRFDYNRLQKRYEDTKSRDNHGRNYKRHRH